MTYLYYMVTGQYQQTGSGFYDSTNVNGCQVTPQGMYYTGKYSPPFHFCSQQIIFLLAEFLLTFTVEGLNEHFIFLEH